INPCHSRITPRWTRCRCPERYAKMGVAALSAVAESIQSEAVAVPDLEVLAQLLYLTAGITRHRKHPGGDIWFRRSLHRSTLRSRSEERRVGKESRARWVTHE